MEPQELNVEKNELFEDIRGRFARAAKPKSILYGLFGLLLGIKLLYETFHHAPIVDQLIITALFFLYVLIGAVWINWYHKIAKTNNAQELLTIYNRKKIIEIITTVFSLLALVGISISVIKDLPFDLPLLITLMAIGVLMPPVKKKEIEQLRELVQKK